jgi:2-C-methyl-D-erythritol 2,4-cyclodiphosphate synthase
MEELGYKIGSGYDVHAFAQGRKLVVGGVTMDFHMGLDGHSDADVLVHAVCDAVLGAVGLGDIGEHFPDTDSSFKGVSSMLLLEKCEELMMGQGYEVVNLDCIIFAQVPKISPYKREMEKNIAGVLKVDASLVNVKATTTEKLGFIGRKEGMSAQCTLLVKAIHRE